jgi:AraC-like DNA-binding protein
MIKASIEVLHPTSHQSFHIREFGISAFHAPYHFHAEIELTAIIKGQGERYIGNHMENFQDGDLVLLGPHLPHCWKLDQQESNLTASAIVVQFDLHFLGESFYQQVEMAPIKRLLEDSMYGIHFNTQDAVGIHEQLIALKNEPDHFQALISLLQILKTLSSCNYRLLDKDRNSVSPSSSEQERMNFIVAYIVENFNRKISLQEAADRANLTTNAFCKYFKKNTRKTFMEMVIDYRINYARQQLIQTDKPISDIAFESGFGDPSHFYKSFRSKTNLSPVQYRKKFFKGVA